MTANPLCRADLHLHTCRSFCAPKDMRAASYLRVLSAAKTCGCQFHFGSDAHYPKMFDGVHALLERAAERIGLCEDDLRSVVRTAPVR